MLCKAVHKEQVQKAKDRKHVKCLRYCFKRCRGTQTSAMSPKCAAGAELVAVQADKAPI